MRGCFAFVVASSVVFLSTSARASGGEARTARLVTNSEVAACVPGEALALAVARRLGASPFDDRAPDTVTVIVEEADASSLRATVVWDGADGTTGRRELRAAGCDALLERVAVTISVLLESTGEADRPKPRPPPEPPMGAEATEFPDRPAFPKPTTSPEAGRGLRVALGVGLAAGSSPEPAPSGDASVEIGLGRFALGLGGRADLPTSRIRDDGKGVRASLAAFELAPCIRAVGGDAPRDRRLDLCALGLAGALFGEGIGVSEPDRATSFFAAVGPRATFELPLAGRLGIYAFSDLLVPITRTTMRVEHDALWTAPVVQMRLGLGLSTSIL
jgi:hypothetical protein